MWERGWDTEHGGILYFPDVYGKPVQEFWQDMKFWWPHNEAIIATLLTLVVPQFFGQTDKAISMLRLLLDQRP